MAKHDVIAERPTRSIVDTPIDSIKPDADQPRKTFPDDHIKELADSIRERGLIQPIIVRPIAEGGYIIVAGECRWRACKLLELPSICCVVEDIDDREARLRSIVENLQRRDMNPIDEARAFKCLLDDGYSVERIVKDLGLNSASIVRQRLDLLNLTPEISQLVLTKNFPVNMAWGIALAPPQFHSRLMRDIGCGKLRTSEQVKSAGMALRDAAVQLDAFAAFDECAKPATQDVAALSRLEAKIEQIASMIQAGFKDGECVAAQRVDPDRVKTMADQLSLIRKHVTQMEHQLRIVATQNELRLEFAA